MINREIKIAFLFGLAFVFSGCVSAQKFNEKNGECVRQCSNTYSVCLSKFTLYPILHKNDCTSAYNICGNSCPAK